MHYKVYNLIAAIDDLLPGLIPTDRAEADVQVSNTSSETFYVPSQPFMEWHLPGRELWLSFFKLDDGYLLRFEKLADFLIRNSGKEIVCLPRPEIPSNTIHHLLLNQVIPLVINLKGSEALHASAVLTPNGVVAFAGPAGSGKSTLAGSLINMGYSLVSDDCLVLAGKGDGIYGIPAYPGLRLWDDSLSCLFGDNDAHKPVAHYTNKWRVDIKKMLETYCTKSQPLKRLYHIVASTEIDGKTDIIIEQLSLQDSFMALVTSAFRLDITDREMLKRQFRFLERVTSTVSVRRLIYPRNFRLLPAVREAILKDLQDLEN
ncbi:MAG: hypothetical protein LUQ65_04435 [Candidatus Helarchaeota archaeon]|nr:hypothetical protein [Candidatus Helarchaeota archaeon]